MTTPNQTAPSAKIDMLHGLFWIYVFLSAALLFAVQPMAGKFLLPHHGSSPGVWGASLVFYQTALFVGYLYAHMVSRIPSLRLQVAVHGCLGASALLFLPILPDPIVGSALVVGEEGAVVLSLALGLGIPFIFLSATSPLIQSWLSFLPSTKSPYRLYAVSNAGSLLGLMSYPFLIEPLWGLSSQEFGWTVGFGLLVILLVLVIAALLRADTGTELHPLPDAEEAGRPVPDRMVGPVLWFTLSGLGTVLLLSSILLLTRNLPPVPFLYALPLAIYLLTFIIAFRGGQAYLQPLVVGTLGVVIPFGIALYRMGFELPFLWVVLLHLLVLFIACLALHGELYRLRPKQTHLTTFYLIIAAGGSAGAMFVSLAAPHLFDSYIEFLIGLGGAWLIIVGLTAWNLLRNGRSSSTNGTKKLKRQKLQMPGNRHSSRVWLSIGLAACALLPPLYLLLGPPQLSTDQAGIAITRERSFFGISRVLQNMTGSPMEHRRLLYHGTTLHGAQLITQGFRRLPTTYYGPDSGIGQAIAITRRNLRGQRGLRLGVIGLGAGTLASYANSRYLTPPSDERLNDSIVFFEIDSTVVTLAGTYFTFLQDARGRGANVNIVLGDARQSLVHQRETPFGFDVLAVDAFSGDAIPTHLITREAIDLFRRHVLADGLIALHISNRYLDLWPVVASYAEQAGLTAVLIRTPNLITGDLSNEWVLITSNQALASDLSQLNGAVTEAAKKHPTWTDDRSSLLSILK